MANPDISSMANQSAHMPGAGAAGYTAREVEVMLSANTGRYQKEMKQAAESTNHLVEALEKVEKAYNKTLRGMGLGMMGLGASLQATMTGSIASAAQFEEAFARVAKTTGLQNTLGGKTGGVADFAATLGFGSNELQQFENDVRRLSTTMPVGVNELSHLADVAGTLGVESENLTLFSETAAQLGAGINELASDQAIAGLSNLIGAFGDSESSVDQLGSSLAELANKTRGSASEMLQFSDRLAGTAVQVGMTSEEVLGLGAAVSAIGMEPQAGASAIGQVITKISRDIQVGGEKLERFASVLGMTREELETLWQSEGGASTVLMRFLEALNAQGEEATVTLERLGLGGVRITQVLGGLAAQIDTTRHAMELSNKAYDEGTAVAELAAIRFDTVVSSLRTLRQSLGEVIRSMGFGFLEVVKGVVSTATNMVNIFNEIPQGLKTLLGLFVGLGGSILIAAGAFTMLFAQFHAFVAAVSLAQALLPMLIGWMQTLGIHGIQAANHLGLAASKLSGFAQALLGATRSGQGFLGKLGNIVLLGLRPLGKALGFVANQFRNVMRWLVVETWHEMRLAISLLARGTGRLATRLGFLVPVLGKIALVAGALGAAYWLITQRSSAWAEATHETTSALRSLSNEAKLAHDEVKALNNELGGSSDGSRVDIAVEARDLIQHLQELEDEAAEDYLFRYAFELLDSGESPTEVERVIEKLAELSDTPIEFEYSLREMRDSENIFDRLDDIVSQTRHNPAEEGTFSRFFNWLKRQPTPLQEAEFDQAVDPVIRAASGMGLPGRIALTERVMDDTRQALEDGLISEEIARSIQDRLLEQNLIPSELDRNQGLWDDIKDFSGIRSMFDSDYVPPSQREIRLDPQELLATYAEDDLFGEAETLGGDRLQELLRDSVGDVDDLGQAIRDLNEADFNDLMSEVEALQVQMTSELSGIDAALESTGNRVEDIFLAASGFSDDQSAGRFLEHTLGVLPQEIGYESAIQQASAHLQSLIEQDQQWSEEAERVRDSIETWGEEYARLSVQAVQTELDSAPAREQVQILMDELEALTRDPWNVQVRAEFEGMLQQSFQAEQQEFRQTMQQYDRLIDQREETVRQHNERLEKMAEDRDASVADAHETYRDRLEEINKAEKEALDEQAEQQASAFDILERHQARPSASLGGAIANMRAQNDAMQRMTGELNQLRSMGLHEDLFEELGLTDPQNFGQVRRLLEGAINDPTLIDEMNRLWGERLDLSSAFVDEAQTDEITERFDEQRKAAEEQLDDTLERISERHSEAVADANENHQRQLENISDQLGELGDRSFETLDELIEKASDSGLEKLEEWAKEIKETEREVRRALGIGYGEWAEGLPMDFDPNTLGLGEWPEGLEMDWDRAEQSNREGARNTTDAVVEEFERGTSAISSVMDDWAGSIDTRLEDALELVEEMENTMRSQAAQSARMTARAESFADGGMLPDSARIQGPGTLVQWAEPETGGEAFIPLAPSKRERSRAIWMQTGKLLGMDIAEFANGGLSGAMPRTRGREPMGGGQDLVKAFTKALQNASFGEQVTRNYGPITVEAQDPNEMERKLDQRRRLSNLAGGRRGSN